MFFFLEFTRGKSESLYGTSGAAPGGEDVFSGGVDFGVGKFVDIEVGRMLGVRGVSVVAGGNDRVEELPEELVALVVTGNHSHGFDHGVT